ncbi:MAG: purine-binding chemotaxis protein CheW [Betaproteobacteria bacterium]|nr:purine-binding chemotaxis protein CheW [Betaproteobacteria bacterium]
MDQTILIFGHGGARYALEATAVREVVWLPELSPIEELPPYVAGVFNLRGRVVPVMDLGMRFGRPRERYRLGDRIIVLESNEARVGIVVNELHDVLALPDSAIEPASSYQGAGGVAQFVRGEAKLDDSLVMLLDIDALLQSAPAPELVPLEAIPGTPASHEQQGSPAEQIDAEEARILRERSRALARAPDSEERAGAAAYAVVGLNGELFGLGADVVRRFSHLRNVAPIPCSPAHIVGNMNLRGDILTLADIRPVLGMPIDSATSEVVVVHSGELLVGIPVSEVADVVYLAASDVSALPVASDSAGKDYCLGVATVEGRAISVLDVEKLLAAPELQVTQELQREATIQVAASFS